MSENVDKNREIATALTGFLADTTVVYLKTHIFHWNVEGPNFFSLHIMFEDFYKKLWKSMDDIAERVRALGEKVPPSFAELMRVSTIKEGETAPAGHIMVKTLRDDYLALAKRAHEISVIADAHGDLITTDMLTTKATFLEKASWMLQSTAIS